VLPPPPEKAASSSSASIANATVSSPIITWTTWSASSEDLDTTGNPASTLNTAQLDPWTVDIHDMPDDETENSRESESFNRILIAFPLIWF
jgi:hypothetical protein